MLNKRLWMALLAFSLLLPIVPMHAQDMPIARNQAMKVVTIKPNYMPPSEILTFLGVDPSFGREVLEWSGQDGIHAVEIRHNEVANLLILSGGVDDIDYITELIQKADIPPRQIEIEVKIIEVSKSKMQDIGIDWDLLIDRANPRINTDYRKNSDNTSTTDRYITPSDIDETTRESDRTSTDKNIQFSAGTYLADVINVLDQSGAGSAHNAPRILTLNNRRAELLDGQRVTYVTRFSSYSNLYETETMNAGLNLSVLPSLGESGYITLDVTAELTTLGGTIANSPVKSGQMVENTIIVKNGESVILGGLSKVVHRTTNRRFPVLGYILPFIFSHKTTIDDEIQSFIVLTPKVVDFNTAIDSQTQQMINTH